MGKPGALAPGLAVRSEDVPFPSGRAPGLVGKRTFQAELTRISAHITVGEDSAAARAAGRTLARARRSVEAGDYLQALEAIGHLDITVQPLDDDGSRPPKAGQVEQALGDVRRLLAEAALDTGHEGGVLLWSAARQAVIEGRWETALALLDEAREWVAKTK